MNNPNLGPIDIGDINNFMKKHQELMETLNQNIQQGQTNSSAFPGLSWSLAGVGSGGVTSLQPPPDHAPDFTDLVNLINLITE